MKFPVKEMLKLIEFHSSSPSYEGILRQALGRFTEVTKSLFSRDVADLLWLDYGLHTLYTISPYGMKILEGRLGAIYSDCLEFGLTSNYLKRLEVRPVKEAIPKIEEVESISMDAIRLSKEIGNEVGIEIRYMDRSLQFQEI
ncbi:hypothetical protein KEJ19_06520 [Candidatus Bathyarchaeota archaeon]|nr:hypothetical protein [Candidatus Bathyarchaeota archaeon]